jgi:hypothetical protein
MTKTKNSRAVKRPTQPTLKLEDFKYLDSQGFAFPQIVLGIKHYRESFNSDYPPRAYDFKAGAPKFRNIAHQTSGLGCDQFYVTGTLLEPKSVEVLRGMQEIERKWLDSNVGVFGGATLEQLNDYERDLLRLFGASANRTHGDFCEALFPFDIEHLPKIAANCPDLDALDEWIEWDSGWSRSLGCVGRFKAYILGQNSD